jgi:dsRNA-specific ribonuclease
VFTLSVRLEGEIIGRGTGKTKKQASQEACRQAMKSLSNQSNPGGQVSKLNKTT